MLSTLEPGENDLFRMVKGIFFPLEKKEKKPGAAHL